MKILLATPVKNAQSLHSKNYVQQLKLPKEVELEYLSLKEGPLAIESLADEISGSHYLIKEILAHDTKDIDAIVINCFADPGLHPLREILNIPVVGAGESAWLLACSLGLKIGHISILKNSRPHAQMKLAQMGLERRLAASTSIDTGVLALADDQEKTIEAIVKQAKILQENHAADVLVLGCTGMNNLINELRVRIAAPLVEPTEAGLWFALAQASANFKYGRQWLYAPANEEYV